jgi:hypothetical protein
MNKRLVFVAMWMAAVSGADAVEPDENFSPPAAPLVQPMPSMMHLKISVKDAENSVSRKGVELIPRTNAILPDRVKTIEIIKTQDIRFVRVTRQSGRAEDFWILANFIYTKSDQGGRIFSDVYTPLAYPAYLRPGATFYGTDWIDLKHYQGIRSYQNQCYYYETGEPPTTEESSLLDSDTGSIAKASPPSRTPVYKAWIDAKTKFPVAVELPDGLYEYAFSAPPVANLQPPPEFVEDHRSMIEAARKRSQEASVR